MGGVCGTVAVPLDWMHPAQGTINIFFELFTHTTTGPAQSAILVNFGGPGGGTIASAGFALYLFSADLDVHDLLLIDDRGRGYSGTIGSTTCYSLQHGTEPFAQSEAGCAAQLGQAASRYGTGDIAQDTEAVRAALGYAKVDYYGLSAGGQDVSAYATRFGAHLRSIVLDAPYGPPGLDQFFFEQARTQAESRKVTLDCIYFPTLYRKLRSFPRRGILAGSTSASVMAVRKGYTRPAVRPLAADSPSSPHFLGAIDNRESRFERCV
jgi:pimeloyl-ACP methyl ester carboxylesterase